MNWDASCCPSRCGARWTSRRRILWKSMLRGPLSFSKSISPAAFSATAIRMWSSSRARTSAPSACARSRSCTEPDAAPAGSVGRKSIKGKNGREHCSLPFRLSGLRRSVCDGRGHLLGGDAVHCAVDAVLAQGLQHRAAVIAAADQGGADSLGIQRGEKVAVKKQIILKILLKVAFNGF